METVNPNLKSCLNDEEVVVKSRSTKVVDKSRQTTLISPNVEGAKKRPFKSTNKKAASVSNPKHIATPVAQNFPNINPVVQNMLPHQAIHPPPHAFPVLPAGANPVVDPITQQVYIPAFIPVPSGSTDMSQPLTYLTPIATQNIENSANIIGPRLREISGKESSRLENNDKYHSSELDYFLGGTAQYLNEKSQRKRSRSFSNHSSSSYRKSDSGTRKRRRRYSQRSDSRNSYRSHRSSFPSDRSHSYRPHDRYDSQRSRQYSGHSGSRSGSIHGSRLYSRSPSDRSLSRSRSISPHRSGSYRLNSGSRSPVSENSFVGSFLTVSEANSRDSVRSRSRERSRSHFSDMSYREEYFSDIDSVTGNVRDYRYSRNSESVHGGRSSLSPIPDSYWERPQGHHRDRIPHISPGHRSDPYRHRPPSFERHAVGRDYERDRYDHHHRYHSDRISRSERPLEKISDVENVSNYEEVSDLEEISDSDTSITWKETNSRPQSQVSGTYYEAVSDTEEPLDDGAKSEKTDIAVNLDVTETSQELQYDGYLDPRIENTSKEKNDLEEVSDSEMQLNESQSPVKEIKLQAVSESEDNTISATATSFIKEVLSGLSSNNAKEDLNTDTDKPLSDQVVESQDSGVNDKWSAVSNSAVQVYTNLGLMKDENNKLIYIGQGNTDNKEQETGSNIMTEERNIPLDESLQGYIKTLWQFPHTGVLHMTYANFVMESEAYKDEFIAEIIHIILGLDLPYVTLNKLRNAVRVKTNIQLASVEELRRILALYPKYFILRQHSGSDSEEEEDPEMQTSTVRVNLKVEVRLCERHRALPYNTEVCPCNALHICPFYLLTECNKTECALGHDLRTVHNVEVMTEYSLHRSTLSEIVEYFRNADHRMVDTVPAVCKFFNRRRGCAKESEIDDDDLCLELHLCFFYAMDSCRKGNDCELSHDITKGQPLVLLKKFGLDPNENGEFNILSLIRTFMRTRRIELETLHEKLTDKSLTENEIKLCIARGINPKLLQMTKNLKGQQFKGGLGDGNVLDVESTYIGHQENLYKDDSGAVIVSDETDAMRSHSTLSLQMKAQKALIEKALMAKDEGGSAVIKQTDQKAVIPVICKFYNNEIGCARGNETCEFIHVCHHFVMGDCKYYDKCKRSHDLTSGQPEGILTRLGLVYKTEDEIIEILRKLCGATLMGEESNSGKVGSD